MQHARHHFDHDDRPTAWSRLGEKGLSFLQTRTAEHWVMFLAGIVVGLILG